MRVSVGPAKRLGDRKVIYDKVIEASEVTLNSIGFLNLTPRLDDVAYTVHRRRRRDPANDPLLLVDLEE